MKEWDETLRRKFGFSIESEGTPQPTSSNDAKDPVKFVPKGWGYEKALFGELQLALYSRAWELSHPGDLVVGAGITTLGFDSNHYIEASGLAPSWVLEGGFGGRVVKA